MKLNFYHNYLAYEFNYNNKITTNMQLNKCARSNVQSILGVFKTKKSHSWDFIARTLYKLLESFYSYIESIFGVSNNTPAVN